MIKKFRKSSISLKEIEHLLKLARIEISEKEKKDLQKEVSTILDYVGQLQNVDTKRVEELSQITGLENTYRQDKAFDVEGLPEELINLFPEKDARFLKVKEVFSNKP